MQAWPGQIASQFEIGLGLRGEWANLSLVRTAFLPATRAVRGDVTVETEQRKRRVAKRFIVPCMAPFLSANQAGKKVSLASPQACFAKRIKVGIALARSLVKTANSC